MAVTYQDLHITIRPDIHYKYATMCQKAWTGCWINSRVPGHLRGSIQTHAISAAAPTLTTCVCSNRPISQIPECIRQISHNASFCNRNVRTCAYFSYKLVHCGIWDWCIVGFVQQASVPRINPSATNVRCPMDTQQWPQLGLKVPAL